MEAIAMLSKAVQDALNEQIKQETYSSYLYLAMSSYCHSTGFHGFAQWLRVQSGEESGHAHKIFDFVNERGGRAMLKAIEQPPVNYPSPVDCMEKAYDHEQKISGMINRLYELAQKEKDYPTQVFLQWFVKEQVEEEQNVAQILEQIKLVGKQGPSLFLVDRALAARKGD
jgi:ferritin